MTTDESSDTSPTARSTPWALWLLMLGAIIVVLALRTSRMKDDRLLGRPFPPLVVAGWLNAPRPLDAAALRGQVVLVDFWATWCGPCVAEMPELVEFYHKYRDEGLVIIGLTSESPADAPYIQSFVSGVPGLTWPIGYGAGMVFETLGVEYVPTLVLFDRRGKSVWTSHGLDGLEEAVIAALAEKSLESRVQSREPEVSAVRHD